MSHEGDQGVSQSGSMLQEVGTMSPRNGKRGRDQREEGRHPTALGMDVQCVKAMDLNLSSDTVSSGGGGNGREDQDLFLNNLALSQSEKRIKWWPSNLESNSQTPIPSNLTANVDVVASDGANNVRTEMTSQIERGTLLYCAICSVKSTSAKDLETHLAGKRHAKAKELASGMGTPSITESSRGVFEAKVHPPENIQASIENGSIHLSSNMHTTSIGQQVLVDGSGEASKDNISGCAGGTNVEEVNFQTFLSKFPDSSDANAVTVGQHASIECPFRETLVNQVSKNDPSSKLDCNDGHNRYMCQLGTNGTFHNPTLADSLLEKICSRTISEGEPYKHLMASLSTKSNSDCVARALASALSTNGCPGLGDLQKSSSCDQAGGCSESQLEGAMSADSNGMVTMHARCFSNLLHEVRISVMEDLFQYGGLKTNNWLPSDAPVSASAPHGEDLNCSVCRVEYGSKADLDLHLAGRKHASLVQRVYSRCQLCNLNCNTERDFKTHLSGKKHASKLRLVQKRVNF